LNVGECGQENMFAKESVLRVGDGVNKTKDKKRDDKRCRPTRGAFRPEGRIEKKALKGQCTKTTYGYFVTLS